MAHYYTDNKDLKSCKRQFTYYFDNEVFTFTTDNGVFSKGQIDYGSYLLIKNVYKKDLGEIVLDLGCGYGPIGIIINRFNKTIKMSGVDVNSRALELAKENALINKVDVNYYLTDDIKTLNTNFDSIILNPPIRAGKKIIYGLYESSFAILNQNGSLYIVIQKKQGAESSIKELQRLFQTVTVLDKDGGYYVIVASKQQTH